MSQFTNKVVVITGGKSGIGLATALEFQWLGAQVVATRILCTIP
jgi:NAD(P)-dependent dehydrogenase (short-subunit alcohol dehydrogenase family)